MYIAIIISSALNQYVILVLKLYCPYKHFKFCICKNVVKMTIISVSISVNISVSSSSFSKIIRSQNGQAAQPLPANLITVPAYCMCIPSEISIIGMSAKQIIMQKMHW